MDRIRKALDLARQERQEAGDVSGGTSFGGAPYPGRESAAVVTSGATSAAAATAGAANPGGSSPGSAPLGVITYVRTRVFRPDAAVLERHRILNPDSDEPAAAAFRMLRTQVLQRMQEHAWRSLAIFSASENDGKSTLATNLAISMANDRAHTALLVEFDFKRPTIAASLGLEPEAGADDVLLGRAQIEECLCHPEGFERLVILPARARLANSSEILAGPTTRDLVAELRSRYPDRLLIFDLPPVLGADDALAFAPLADCGLLVVAEGKTRREDVLRTMELLRKTPILGTALNRATTVAPTYA